MDPKFHWRNCKCDRIQCISDREHLRRHARTQNTWCYVNVQSTISYNTWQWTWSITGENIFQCRCRLQTKSVTQSIMQKTKQSSLQLSFSSLLNWTYWIHIEGFTTRWKQKDDSIHYQKEGVYPSTTDPLNQHLWFWSVLQISDPTSFANDPLRDKFWYVLWVITTKLQSWGGGRLPTVDDRIQQNPMRSNVKKKVWNNCYG